MAERYVRMNIISTGGDKAKATLDDLALKARKLEAESPDLKITADDTKAQARIKDLQLKIEILNRMKAEIAVESKGDEATKAKLLDISAQLHKLDATVAKPGMDLEGFDRTEARLIRIKLLLDSIHNKNIRVSESGSKGSLFQRLLGWGNGNGGLFKGLGGLLSGRGGGGGLGTVAGEAAGGGAGGAGSGILSAIGGASNSFTGGVIGSLLVAAASISPALIPFLLGGGVGIGGGIGAAMLGSTATTKLAADRKALASARAAIAGSKSGGSKSQLLALHQDRAQLAHDQGLYGAFAPFGKTVSRLGHSALDTFAGALTSRPLLRRGGEGPGTHGEVRGQSFLGGLTGIVGQVGGFMKSMGPGLGQMFRASLPFIGAVVKIMEQFAKAVLPAVTQSMKQLTPFIPQIVQGFKYLSEGIAGFIKALGPGMKDAVTVFKAIMVGVKGILIALGHTFSFLAIVFAKWGHNVKQGAEQIAHFFERMWHYVVSDSLSGWHKLKAMEQEGLHEIAHIFDTIRHTVATIWDTIWRNTVTRVQHGINDVRTWFNKLPGIIGQALRGLGSLLYGIGKSAITSFINGLKSTPIGGVIGGITSAVKWFTHASGGWINEPVVGIGMNTGNIHSFAEVGPEYISPAGSMPTAGGGTSTIVLQFDTADDGVMSALARAIRVRGGDPRVLTRKVQLA